MNYTFSVTASKYNPKKLNLISLQSSVTIQVGKSNVVAILSCGSSLIANVNDDITIDASSSYDMDYPNDISILIFIGIV
jgi:hypothetical protein